MRFLLVFSVVAIPVVAHAQTAMSNMGDSNKPSGTAMSANPGPAATSADHATPQATPTHPTAPVAPETPATAAYRTAMMQMHMRMDIPYNGDPDRDFVAGMLPHHQGAVDMAKVELQYGHDSALRHLAQGIIAAQEKEIAFMQGWQRRHLPGHATSGNS